MGNELTKKFHSTDEQNEEGQEEIETTVEDLTRCLETQDGNKRNHLKQYSLNPGPEQYKSQDKMNKMKIEDLKKLER